MQKLNLLSFSVTNRLGDCSAMLYKINLIFAVI